MKLFLVFMFLALSVAQESSVISNTEISFQNIENTELPAQKFVNVSQFYLNFVNVASETQTFVNATYENIQNVNVSWKADLTNITIKYYAVVNGTFLQTIENFIANFGLYVNVMFNETSKHMSGIFSNVNYMNCAFMSNHFENVAFTNANFLSVTFEGSHFKNVSFVNCNFNQVTFKNTRMKNVYMNSSNYNSVTFEDAIVEISLLENVNMMGVDMDTTVFNNVLVNGEHFTGIGKPKIGGIYISLYDFFTFGKRYGEREKKGGRRYRY